MSDITAGYVFANGATFTPTKLNDAIGLATISAGALSADTTGRAKMADGYLTLAKLAEEVLAKLMPAGAVQAFAMNTSPTGWLACDGSAILRATYVNLFTAISTVYGAGDGSTTFNIPDLRGYFVRGSGTNGDGTAAGTFGEKQADDFRSHSHTYNSPIYQTVGGPGSFYPFFGPGNTASGAAGGTETRPKNIAMMYCIKY